MQQDWKFWLPALAAVSGIIVAVVASYLGGFLGIAIAGLAITFAAVRYDLEKSDVGGGFPSPSLYARQTAVRAKRLPGGTACPVATAVRRPDDWNRADCPWARRLVISVAAAHTLNRTDRPG